MRTFRLALIYIPCLMIAVTNSDLVGSDSASSYQMIPHTNKKQFCAMGYGFSQLSWGYEKCNNGCSVVHPLHVLIDRDQTGTIVAEAFAFGNHARLIKKWWIDRMRDMVFYGFNNENDSYPDKVLTWDAFASSSEHKHIAALFKNAHQKRVKEPSFLMSNLGTCIVLPPKNGAENKPHITDHVTYWKPSRELFELFMTKGTVLSDDLLGEDGCFEGVLNIKNPSLGSFNDVSRDSRVAVNAAAVTKQDLLHVWKYQTGQQMVGQEDGTSSLYLDIK